MKTKQYSVKVFEITLTDKNKFFSFFDTNYSLFKDHLISINGEVSKDVEKYLNEKQLKYIINVELPQRQRGKTTPITPKENKQEIKETTKQEISQPVKKEQNLKVLDSLVRSGQELNIEGDLLLLNRVNSGANININGNLIVTQIVDGSIRCNGTFMMLKASAKANIVFQGMEVENSFLKERLNRVELINDEIVVTPVLKETSWV